VRKMAELLERTQSSYFPTFKDIFRDVVAGNDLFCLLPDCIFNQLIFTFGIIVFIIM